MRTDSLPTVGEPGDDDSIKSLPLPSIRRLPSYLRLLYTLKARGREVVSCTHIADELELVSVQVRKDLAMTGIVGRPKIGYQVGELIDAIERFLGWKNTTDALLVGVGGLGSALLGYEGFKEYHLNVLAGFDIDPAKIGTQVHGKEVFALDKLPDLLHRLHVLMGIITVPAAAAQEVTNLMVRHGIRAIWNYTPVQLQVPDAVIVEDVKLAASLAVLSSRLAETLRRTPAPAGLVTADTEKE
jgi:redox-sensing transcriptional repressor